VVVAPDGCEILTLLPTDAGRAQELLGRAGLRAPSRV
jgi:hypothetical protein